MNRTKFVIVGGGIVAGYASKTLVELGLRPNELKIISADAQAPYERPPLSKGFLLGKDDEASIRINPASFYQENGIEVLLNCAVKSINAHEHRLTLQNGEELAYDSLVLATGCQARRLTIPGSHLPNVLHLRSMNDSSKIREAAQGAKRAVVLGGGFIGMEVTSVLTQLKIETTMAMPDDRVWKAFFTPEMSQFFEGYYKDRGVHFAHGARVVEVQGPTSLSTAVCADGQRLACDLLVAGIGAQATTDYLAGSGVEVSNGVKVNEYLETSVPGVYAAGDIANYPDNIFGKRRRVEHWDNAVSQGQHVARVLMGERVPFKHVPYFFSDVFDLSYELWGDATDADNVTYRGDQTTRSFSVWWTKAGTVTAAFLMNRPDEEHEFAPRAIEAKEVVDVAMLADDTQPVANSAKGSRTLPQ